jgi:ribokinase
MRAAVVGHHEWVQFLRVDHVPAPGEIVHAQDWWELPAGGGSAAAVQLAKLASDAVFFTAFGDDELGHRAKTDLEGRGLRVEATFRPEATRRAVTHVDPSGERTITVVGDRLEPRASDPLPWEELAETDAVYLTAGDAPAVHLARNARVLVATARVLPRLVEAGVELDALVGSAVDPAEAYREGDLVPPPRLVVRTEGGAGGTYATQGESARRYEAAPLPGTIVDRYGAGDSFAGALAFALAEDRPVADAIAFASRCGAAVLTGRGPYEGQLGRDGYASVRRRPIT